MIIFGELVKAEGGFFIRTSNEDIACVNQFGMDLSSSRTAVAQWSNQGSCWVITQASIDGNSLPVKTA